MPRRKSTSQTPESGSSSSVKYRANVGLKIGDTRYSKGDELLNLPEKSVKWLLDGGYITKVN